MSDYIPDEILANIFIKLTAKEVLDCRCVCKSWLSVISNSTFVSQYTQLALNNKNNNGRFILSYYDTEKCKEVFTLQNDDASFGQEYEELDLPFDHGLSSYMIIGFCFGLVCLLEISDQERLPESLVIWNPSVGYSFKAFPIEPPVGKIDQQEKGYGPSIRFSEGKALLYTIFGFGYDMKSNGYKVVRIVYRAENFPGFSRTVAEIVDVFTLNMEGWKNITASAPPYVIQESSAHAFLNGALHWIGYYDDGSDEILVSQLMLAVFDISDEVFKEFKLPDELIGEAIEREEDRQVLSVGVISESLALMHYQTYPHTRGQNLYICNIWLMNEYGETDSWMKFHILNLHLSLGKILWLKRNDDFVVGTSNQRERDRGELHAVNMLYPLGRRLKIEGNPWNFFMDTYIECLIIYKKVDGVPTMSTSFAATTSQQAVAIRTNGLKTTDKGKEIMEEEE